MNPIDQILDDNNTDNIVLYNEEGESIEFEQIALIPLDGDTFVILHPVDQLEGMNEDEALVFGIENVDGEDTLVIVEDEDVVDAVFEEYYIMLEEAGVDVE